MDACGKAATAAADEARWTIVAGPFTRADRLRAFIVAVGRMEGVTELVAERFRLGELSLTLRYSGAQPLAGRLAALAGFWPWVEVEGSGMLRLVIEDALAHGDQGGDGAPGAAQTRRASSGRSDR